MFPALLVNENFPAPSTVVLRTAGCDVLAIADAHAGLPDPDVLALACAQNRWLITFDRDYGELLFGRRLPAPPAVILMREPHYSRHEPAQWLLRLLAQPEISVGSLVVLTRDSIRRRPLLRERGASF